MDGRAGASNEGTDSARRYHEGTAHSPESVRASTHRLVWEIKPSPFKIYPDLPPIPLPRDLPPPALDAFPALSGSPALPRALDLPALASLLFFSAGITRRRSEPGVEIFFRAAPSTGALYQTEVYAALGPEMAGLPAGIYHFSPGDFALRRLREGDFRRALAEAAADERMARAGATLILSAIYWRNTWKYQARGYRHLFWDAGSMLANALAAATALDLPARLVTGFADDVVNHLLGLDADTEGALALLPVGAEGAAAGAAPPQPPLRLDVIPLSARAVDYPAVRAAYRHSSLEAGPGIARWREAGRALGAGPDPALSSGSRDVPLPPASAQAGRSLGETILARGSTREFSGEPITTAELSACLYHAAHGFPADVPPGLVDLYLTVHAVDGIAPGAYAYHADRHRLELLAAGEFRREAAFLCLDQPLGGMSSATVFFLVALGPLLDHLGNRGYRVANLEAGLVGGRLYLGAYAQRFGATGLTFYDRPVVRFFSPHAAGKEALFVTALGRSVRSARRAGG